MIQIKTNVGSFKLELYPEKAPKTVENFLRYVKDGFYNGTVFHRVINNFMIQGGGMTPDLQSKLTNAAIQNEADNGLKNDIGTIAMARTNEPHSATSQFFINVADNEFLNHTSKSPAGWGYAVFGKVTEGMDVVNKIKAVKTTTKGYYADVPEEDVVIESISIAE